MKKENVYVEVSTEKQSKKLKKVLDMFGEKVFSEKTLKMFNHWQSAIRFECNSWEAIGLKFADREKVSVSELKQILAMDHLKKGDVVIVNNPCNKKGWVLKLEGDNKYFMHKNIYCLQMQKFVKYSVQQSISCGKFIRYATEEEKQLLNPGAKEDEKHTGSFESLRKCDTVDFPSDFKELTKNDYIGKWVVIDCHQYSSFSATAKDAVVFHNSNEYSFGFDYEGDFCNDFNSRNNLHNIKRLATDDEVGLLLHKECIKRYPNKKHFSFNHTKNEIIHGREIVFKNGTWLEAKKIEIDPFKELKEAHKKGFEIEYKSSSGVWKTSSNPAWRKTGNYRIRPVKIGDWFFNISDNTNVKNYYQVNESNINSVGPNHVRILNQMVIDILNNGKYTV